MLRTNGIRINVVLIPTRVLDINSNLLEQIRSESMVSDSVIPFATLNVTLSSAARSRATCYVETRDSLIIISCVLSRNDGCTRSSIVLSTPRLKCVFIKLKAAGVRYQRTYIGWSCACCSMIDIRFASSVLIFLQGESSPLAFNRDAWRTD